MSYPYPQDRTREKREKTPDIYADRRQEMANAAAEEKTEAERWGETHQRATGEQAHARLEENLEEEGKRIQQQMKEAEGGNG